jgi:hypothetical protein
MTEADRVLAYLERHHGAALALVRDGSPAADLPLQDACDVIYSLVLIGREDLPSKAGAQAFAAHANRWRLAGGLNAALPDAPSAVVHLTAYVLGALRLLREAGHDVSADVLNAPEWRLDALFDAQHRPRWPKRYSHHNWRVSHWIGGAPSILFNLWALAPEEAARRGAPSVETVLQAADTLVDPRTGLLRCYKSDLLQQAFRTLYRVRHDPDLGDVGGIVHLHWVNYAADRTPYKASRPLFEKSAALLERRPFMESTPYCLDFDIIQIVRTAASSPSDLEGPVQVRSAEFIADIDRFYADKLDEAYNLHRLPGALATQHEAALILQTDRVEPLGVPPVDIMRRAAWI